MGKLGGSTRDRRLRLKPALVQDTDYMVEKTYHIWGLFNASVTHICFKRCLHIPKRSLELGGQLTRGVYY